MINVLLVLTRNINDSVGLETILQKFEQNNYHIHVFEDNGEVGIETLPTLVDYVRSLENSKIHKLVLLTNIHEMLFIWYRMYNYIVDDFVFFIDPPSLEGKYVISISHEEIYTRIANFSGAHSETLYGKIYINIEENNYNDIFGFLFLNQKFRFFEDFNSFDFLKKEYKSKLEKKYTLTPFYQERHQKPLNFEVIYCEDHISTDYSFSTILSYLNRHEYFYKYLILGVLVNKPFKDNNLSAISYFMLEGVAKLEISTKLAICNFLREQCRTDIADSEKLWILYSTLNIPGTEKYLQEILVYLFKDLIPTEKLYPILLSSLALSDEQSKTSYEKLYQDVPTLLNKISEYYRTRIKFPTSIYQPINKRIAIITSQLKKMDHSPTTLVLNIAKNIVKYYPDFSLKIYSLDVYSYSHDEMYFDFGYLSRPSKNYMNIHQELLKDTDIEIFYSDWDKERLSRLQEEIDSVYSFDPGIIINIDSYSILPELLYESFPILDFMIGELSYSNKADLYTGGNLNESVYEDYKRKNIQNRRYIQHHTAYQFPEFKQTKRRSDYNLEEHDFVMVTVGNRLPIEVTPAFTDMIVTFLRSHPRARWMLVGTKEITYISKTYPELIDNKIIFNEYETELASLYRICDVFINPFRRGGGYSAGLAINESLPVISLSTSLDTVAHIGIENSVGTAEEYFKELSKHYNDEQYRISRGEKLRERFRRLHTFENCSKELMDLISLTKKEFEKRRVVIKSN